MNVKAGHELRVRQLFDRKAPAWNEKYRVALRHRLQLFCDGLQQVCPPPARVLDFGCGSGVYLCRLAELGYQVVGLDFSAAMIEQCKKNLAESHQQASLYCGTLEDARDGLDELDAVMCSSVIEYVPDPVETLRTLRTLLRPQGVVLLTVPNRDSWRKIRQRCAKCLSPMLKPLTVIPKVKGYCDFLQSSVNIYRPHQLRFLSDASRFKLEEWTYFDPVTGLSNQTDRRKCEMLFAMLRAHGSLGSSGGSPPMNRGSSVQRPNGI